MSKKVDRPRKMQWLIAFYLSFACLFGMLIASHIKNGEKIPENQEISYLHPIDNPPAPSLNVDFSILDNQTSHQSAGVGNQESTGQITDYSMTKNAGPNFPQNTEPVFVQPQANVADSFVPRGINRAFDFNLTKQNEVTQRESLLFGSLEQKLSQSPTDLTPLQLVPSQLKLSAVPAFNRVDPSLNLPHYRVAAIPKLKTFDVPTTEEINDDKSPEIIHQEIEIPKKPIRQWAKSPRLAQLLEPLAEHAETQQWAEELRKKLNILYEIPTLEDQAVPAILADLKKISADGSELANELGYTWQRTRLSQVLFALARRMTVWQSMHQIAKDNLYTPDSLKKPAEIITRLDQLEQYLLEGGQILSWSDYLLLDQVRFASSNEITPENRRDLASSIIARMEIPNLTNQQRELLQRPVFTSFKAALKDWTCTYVELPTILSQIEQYESDLQSPVAKELGISINSLLNCQPGKVQYLGQTLDHTYRNANIRFAASRSFMNSLMPEFQPEESSVNDYILGNRVRGRSRTSTSLQVSLIPDASQWRMQMDVVGTVDSNTSSNTGPVTIFNRGRSNYRAAKQLVVNNEGFFVSKAVANVQTATDVADLESDFDSIPLLGSLVRSVAMSQTESKKYDAEREVQFKVKRRAEQELDKGLNEKVELWQEKLAEKVLAPLQQLHLTPAPIEMKTEKSHIVGRFRISGDPQLGAHQPRPVSAPGSVLTAQVHESSINNMIERLNLAGRRQSAEQWLEEAKPLIKGIDEEVLNDIPEGTVIELAQIDPIRVRFYDNQIELTLQIAELKSGNSSWKDISVRSSFELDSDSLSANFSRQDSVKLKGKKLRFRDQIALRTIFSKILSKNLQFPLVPEQILADQRMANFEASQLTMHEGWFALSIRPKKVGRISQAINSNAHELILE